MADTFRLAPDGSLLDRVGEFAFGKKHNIQSLFEADFEGYSDAVAKLVQALASSQKIVMGKGKELTEATQQLKTALVGAARHEESTFFEPQAVEERKKAATEWLMENWSTLLHEFEDPDSAVASAMLGQLKREFYLVYLKIDPKFDPIWYSEDVPMLPTGLRKRFLREICKLARMENHTVDEPKFEQWIDRVVFTHFRIFGEYWLFLGKETGDDYLPSLTRSSLSFLTIPTQRGSIEQLIVPFAGLSAIQKAKNRKDIVDAAVDWSGSEGREVIQGMDRLQNILRTTRPGDDRKHLLAETADILRSRMPRAVNIAINGIRLVTQVAVRQIDVNAAQSVYALTRSSSYRWLWRIRVPELEWEWRKRLQELLD